MELTGGEYEFVIATHVDKEHLHNHIIFSSTNLKTGKAFRWQKEPKESSNKFRIRLQRRKVQK